MIINPLKYFTMEAVVIQINNNQAWRLLENLEALNVIKVLKRIPVLSSEFIKKTTDTDSDRAIRLSEIQAITKNISVDLTNFKFNRDF